MDGDYYFGEEISSALPPPCIRCRPQRQTRRLRRRISECSNAVNKQGAVLMKSSVAASRLKVRVPLGFPPHLSPHGVWCLFVFQQNGAMQRLNCSSTNGQGYFRKWWWCKHSHCFTIIDFSCVCFNVVPFVSFYVRQKNNVSQGNGEERGGVNSCLPESVNAHGLAWVTVCGVLVYLF